MNRLNSRRSRSPRKFASSLPDDRLRRATVDALESRVLMSTSVTVHVYNDPNQNASYTGSNGIAGRQVYVDTNGDGLLENGEPTAVTDSTGTATLSLASISSSQVAIAEVVPTGVAQTSPTSEEATVTVSNPATVSFGNKTLSASPTESGGSYKKFAFSNLGSTLSVTSAVTQPDGKIVVTGADSGGTFVARYLPDGEPDVHFGNNGIASDTPGYLDGESPSGLVVEPNGEIAVMVGGLISLLTTSGAPDQNFAETPPGILYLSSESDFTVTLMPDGSLLCTEVGVLNDGQNVNNAVFAFDLNPSTGQAVGSFGGGAGYVQVNVGSSSSTAFPTVNAAGGFDLVVDDPGNGQYSTEFFSFTAAGDLVTNRAIVPINDKLLAEYPDYAVNSFSPNFQVSSVASQTNGDLLISGTALSPDPDQQTGDGQPGVGSQAQLMVVLARVTSTGSLDTSFGYVGSLSKTNGVSSIDDNENSYAGFETGGDVAVLPDGSILLTTSLLVDFPDQNGNVDVSENQYTSICREFQSNGKVLLGYQNGASNELVVDADPYGSGGNTLPLSPLAPLSGILPVATTSPSAIANPEFVNGSVGFNRTVIAPPAMITGRAVADLDAETAVPTATYQAPAQVTVAGTTPEMLQVEYKDNVSINQSTLGGGNLLITGPTNTTEQATYLGISSGTAQDLYVDYNVAPFGGSWTASENSPSYHVTLLANEVYNTANPVYTSNTNIGTFAVAIPVTPPTASLAAVAPITTTGTTTLTLTVTYKGVGAAINSSSIDTNDISVIGHNTGASLSITGAAVGAASGDNLTVTYTVKAPTGGFQFANNDTYYVAVKANRVTDTNQTAATASTFGSFSVSVPAPDTTPPSASLAPVPSVTVAGTASVTLVVTYTDNTAVKFSSLGVGNITVKDAAGDALTVTHFSPSVSANAASITVTYTVAAPAGGFQQSNDVPYTVALVANQVTDAAGNAAAAGSLGSFAVAIGVPTATLAALAPITTAGVTSVTLNVTYLGAAAAIQASTIGTSDLTVTGSKGETLTVTAATAGATSGLSLPVTYAVAAPAGGFTYANNDTYTVALKANEVADTLGKAAVASTLGSFTVSLPAPDITPPAATLASAASVTAAGTTSLNVAVTYTDATAVKLSTLGTSNITVTGPAGALAIAAASASATANAPSITVTYTVAAPAGGFQLADNGVYTVSLSAAQVTDLAGNVTAAKSLGSFAVAIGAPAAALASVPDVTAAGVASVTLTVTYSGSSAPINSSTIDIGDLIVTGSGGEILAVTAAAPGVASGNALTATYTIGAPSGTFAVADNDTYTVMLVANQVDDTAGTAAPAATLGSFTIAVSSTPTPTPTPTPTLASTTTLSVPVTSVLTGNLLEFNVTVAGVGATPTGTVNFYNGSTALGAATLQGGAATFSTATLPAGTYSVTASYSGDGVYLPSSSAASAPVTVTAAPAGAAALTPALTRAVLPPTLVEGAKHKIAIPITITDTGGQTAHGIIKVYIYASTDQTLDASDHQIFMVEKMAGFRVGKPGAIGVVLGGLPASIGIGTFYLLAQVVDPSGFAQTASTAGTITVAAPFVAPSVAFRSTPRSTTAGRKLRQSTALLVDNAGNVAINGPITFTVYATTDGVIDSGSITVTTYTHHYGIPAGRAAAISIPLGTALSLLPAGTYQLAVTIDVAAANGAAQAMASELDPASFSLT
jgi:hypothetical protein